MFWIRKLNSFYGLTSPGFYFEKIPETFQATSRSGAIQPLAGPIGRRAEPGVQAFSISSAMVYISLCQLLWYCEKNGDYGTMYQHIWGPRCLWYWGTRRSYFSNHRSASRFIFWRRKYYFSILLLIVNPRIRQLFNYKYSASSFTLLTSPMECLEN